VKNTDDLTYRERVLPSIASLLPVLLVIPTAYLTLLPFSVQAGLVVGVSVTVAILASIWFASPVLELDSSGFAVGDSLLPLNVISSVEAISPKRSFEERGVKLSPGAYVRFQISVKTHVKVFIDDQNDPTPYWLIATRDPERVVEVLDALKGR
jgi:uncharacterized protein (DUF58 family)